MRILIVTAVVVLAPALAQAEALELICEGTASIASTETSKIDTGVSNGFGTNHQMTMTSESVRNSERSVAIRVRDDGTGDAKLPGWGMPLWVTKSEDGWRPLTDLQMTDAEISGRFKLNGLNNPTFSINRKTGRMHLRMYGASFNGDCSKAPDKDAPNKF